MKGTDRNHRKEHLEPRPLTLPEANQLIEKLRRIVSTQAERIFELEKIIRGREHRLPVSREGNA